MKVPSKKSLKFIAWFFPIFTIVEILILRYHGFNTRGMPGGSPNIMTWEEIYNILPATIISNILFSCIMLMLFKESEKVEEKKKAEAQKRINDRKQKEIRQFGDVISVKFHEEAETAVLTTKSVIQDFKTITYVNHDAEEGEWQFLSDDYNIDCEKDARVVSIEEIVKIDPTLIELCDLPCGSFAYRNDKSENWIISTH